MESFEEDKKEWFMSLKVGDYIQAKFKYGLFATFKIFQRDENCIWYEDDKQIYQGSCSIENLHTIRKCF